MIFLELLPHSVHPSLLFLSSCFACTRARTPFLSLSFVLSLSLSLTRFLCLSLSCLLACSFTRLLACSLSRSFALSLSRSLAHLPFGLPESGLTIGLFTIVAFNSSNIIQFVKSGKMKTLQSFLSIEAEEEERRNGASGRPRTHLTPLRVNNPDLTRLPLCQTARLRVLFWRRASLYGQFCACRQLEEGGDTLAHMPSAQLHYSRTQASYARLTTHFPGSSRRRAAATPFFETRTLCRTLLAVPGSSLPQFM